MSNSFYFRGEVRSSEQTTSEPAAAISLLVEGDFTFRVRAHLKEEQPFSFLEETGRTIAVKVEGKT